MFMMKKSYTINIIKALKFSLKIYIIYAAICSVIIFGIQKHENSDYLYTHSTDRFFSESVGQDRVVLIEDMENAGLARVNIIQNAEETLDISYHAMDKGVSSNILVASILEAADRGVKVRLLLDGIFHNLRWQRRDIAYALSNHPNIQLKFYEPLSFLRPWTWNNRLHDKMIIADGNISMIGGRNISDKFFIRRPKKNIVYDRDVVIINNNPDIPKSSVIYEMEDYYNDLWNNEFSKYPVSRLTKRQQNKGQKMTKYLSEYLKNIKLTNPSLFSTSYNWLSLSVPTNKITLIHNPIQRFNKEPWCLYDVSRLMEASNHSIFIQSPYIVPTKSMQKYLPLYKASYSEIFILTNSMASTPNLFAYSGHIKYKKAMIDSGALMYEFQDYDSIHAKSYIFDDKLSLIGSFNLDPRSAYLSTESMVVIDSKEFASSLKDKILNQVNNSLMVGKDYSYVRSTIVEEKEVSFLKKGLIRLLYFINYFFDYML